MDRPKIVIHMLVALDGKIAGNFFNTQIGFILNGEYERTNSLYNSDAVLCGRVTTDGSLTFGAKPDLDEDAPPVPEGDYVARKSEAYYVSIDTSGKVGWKTNVVQYSSRPQMGIIEVLSETTSNAYKAFLRKMEISYIIAGKEKLDCTICARKLKELFGIRTVMVSGGGLINWSFLKEGIVDEVSIVYAPVADGTNDTPTLFEKPDYVDDVPPVEFELKDVEKISGGGLWIRYIPKNKVN